MTAAVKPFVGAPTDATDGSCAYSADIDTQSCGQPATIHIIGPADDHSQPHTIARCEPCDDDTHPGRAEADARLIAALSQTVLPDPRP